MERSVQAGRPHYKGPDVVVATGILDVRISFGG